MKPNLIYLTFFCCALHSAYAQLPPRGSYPVGLRQAPLQDMRRQQEAQTETQNREIIQSMGGTLPPTQEEILQNLENQRLGRAQEKTRQEKQLAEIYAILGEEKLNAPQINEADNTQQTYQHYSGFFAGAANELTEMLEGKRPLNLKRAVFLAENPAQGNQLSYADYCKKIARYVAICKELIAENKLRPQSKDVKNWAIQQLYTDTLHIMDKTHENDPFRPDEKGPLCHVKLTPFATAK